MCLTSSQILYAPVNFVKAIWLPQIDSFFKKSQVVCHQQVHWKFQVLAASALQTFSQFWIALYQNLS